MSLYDAQLANCSGVLIRTVVDMLSYFVANVRLQIYLRLHLMTRLWGPPLVLAPVSLCG